MNKNFIECDNKYLSALRKLALSSHCVSETLRVNLTCSQVTELKNVLYELIQRTAPMKPINQRNILGSLAGECVCGKATVFNTQNYCFYCGQALDWSDK